MMKNFGTPKKEKRGKVVFQIQVFGVNALSLFFITSVCARVNSLESTPSCLSMSTIRLHYF